MPKSTPKICDSQTGLSICMIVRDEAEVLGQCLSSLRLFQSDSAVKMSLEIIVVDTGSQDHSIAIARSYGARVSEFVWQNDFSVARNASLEQAQYPWILVLDADEYLSSESAQAIRSWCLQPQDLKACVQLPIWNYDDQGRIESVYRNFRLFPNHKALRYRGSFHEQLYWHDGREAATAHLETAVIHHLGFAESMMVKKSKHQRDLAYLQRLLQARPEYLLGRIHLADSFFRAGNTSAALEHYRSAEASLKAPFVPAGEQMPIEATGLSNPALEASKYLRHCQVKILEILSHNEALIYLKSMALHSRDHPEYWYLCGKIWRQNKEFERAEKAFLHCLSFQERREKLSHYKPAQLYELPWLQLLHVYRWLRLQSPNKQTFVYYNQHAEQACLALIHKFPEGDFPRDRDNLYLFWLESQFLSCLLTQRKPQAALKIMEQVLNTAQKSLAQVALDSPGWQEIRGAYETLESTALVKNMALWVSRVHAVSDRQLFRRQCTQDFLAVMLWPESAFGLLNDVITQSTFAAERRTFAQELQLVGANIRQLKTYLAL